jgi:putative flippase GtrA
MVGTGATALSYAVLMIVVKTGLHYLVAVAFSWLVPMLTSFIIHRDFTFQDGPGDNYRKFFRYFLGAIAQLIIGMTVYFIAIDVVGLDLTMAFLLSTIIAAVVSYSVLRLAVFPPDSRRGVGSLLHPAYDPESPR